jgi:autotransporter-associated beta strand protein
MRRFGKTSRVLIATGAAAVFGSHAYGAGPTLGTYYASGEIATDVHFSTGIQALTLSNSNPVVYLPLNDYFEFGISVDLSDNPNPYAGQGSPAQPSFLGLATVNYHVDSNDTAGAILAPLLTSTVVGTTPNGATEFDATDKFVNVTPSIKNPGDVEIGSGSVGDYQTITEEDFVTPDGSTTAGVSRLALFSGATQSAAAATPYFINLGYKGLATGIVSLSPGVAGNGNGTDYYLANSNSNNPPYDYGLQQISISGAILSTPSLIVYVAPSVIWDGHTDHSTWNTSVANFSPSGSSQTYADPDFVTFNDTAPSNSLNVSLNTTVSPYLVTVNSNTNNYSISGLGAISGSAALIKSGSSTLTLSTVNKYSGPTTVSGGTLIVNTTGALPADNSLSISSGAKVVLATSTGLATLASLSITTNGVFDIANNHVIINYGANDPKTSIIQYLQTGANGGLWNGPGIVSSAAASNSAYGVGFGDGADGVVPGLSSGQIELKYTLYGDINLDGTVNGVDFGILAANFNKGVSNGWESGDFYYQGTVNGVDFGLLASNFNKGDSGTAAVINDFAAQNGLLADVPEPASSSTAGVTTALILSQRRRRRHR